MKTRSVSQAFCDGCQTWHTMDNSADLFGGQLTWLSPTRKWIFFRGKDKENVYSFHTWQCVADFAARQE